MLSCSGDSGDDSTDVASSDAAGDGDGANSADAGDCDGVGGGAASDDAVVV